jgi:hypothetical protein
MRNHYKSVIFGKINFWGNQTIGQKAAGGEIVRVKREDPDGRWNYEAVARTSGKEWGFEVDLQLLFCHLSRDGEMACHRDFYFYTDGNIILTVVPRPTLLSMTAEPPWRSTIDFTKARPRPAPSELRDDSAR